MRVLFFLLACFLPYVQAKFMNIELGGGFKYGLYFIDMFTGSNDQKTRVHVDTGSNLLIIESVGCKTCSAFNGGYNAATSTTSDAISCTSDLCGVNTCYKGSCLEDVCKSTKCCAATSPANCGFYVAYGDGSKSEGHLSKERFVLKSMYAEAAPPVTTTFGVINTQSGNWDEVTDGLMGLAYKELNCSPTCYNTYMDDLYEQRKSEGYRDVFSMCFSDKKGILSIGDLDTSLYQNFTAPRAQNGLYTVDLASEAFYEIRANKISYGDTIIANKRSYLILDSGTTLTLLAPSIYQAMKSDLQTNHAKLPGVENGSIFTTACLVDPPSSEWPTFHYHFDNVKVSIPPSIYFVPLVETVIINPKTYYCFGVDSSGDEEMNLLGDTFMRGFFIVHDREKDVIQIGLPTERCFVTQYGQLDGSPLPADDEFDYGLVIWIVVIVVCVLALLMIVYKTCASSEPKLKKTKKNQAPQGAYLSSPPQQPQPSSSTTKPVPTQPAMNQAPPPSSVPQPINPNFPVQNTQRITLNNVPQGSAFS